MCYGPFSCETDTRRVARRLPVVRPNIYGPASECALRSTTGVTSRVLPTQCPPAPSPVLLTLQRLRPCKLAIRECWTFSDGKNGTSISQGSEPSSLEMCAQATICLLSTSHAIRKAERPRARYPRSILATRMVLGAGPRSVVPTDECGQDCR